MVFAQLPDDEYTFNKLTIPVETNESEPENAVGSIVEFGHYYCTEDEYNPDEISLKYGGYCRGLGQHNAYHTGDVSKPRPIQWIVLSATDTDVLLISRECVGAMPYNDTEGTTEWKDSSARVWLNGTFISEAFEPDEERMLVARELEKGVYDKASLLSVDELLRYMPLEKNRVCYFYVSTWLYEGISIDAVQGGGVDWVLRNSVDGYDIDHAGRLRINGSDDDGNGIRPVIMVHCPLQQLKVVGRDTGFK